MMNRPLSNSFANASESWEWQNDHGGLPTDSAFEIPNCLWEELNPNGENTWSMLDEMTPAKDYTGFDPVSSLINEMIMDKGVEEAKGITTQFKRRRMLQFNSSDIGMHNPDRTSSSMISSEESLEDCNSIFYGDAPSGRRFWPSRPPEYCRTSSENFDQPYENWVSDCLNEQEIHVAMEDINISGISEEQLDVSQFCNSPQETDLSTLECPATNTPRIYYEGTKTFVQNPTSLATSVAYPFTLIKPCGVQGDVTLNDINQKLHTPSLPKTKQKKGKDPRCSFTSAFSGKPVVSLTKIHTEGGKGSITIMRTRG